MARNQFSKPLESRKANGKRHSCAPLRKQAIMPSVQATHVGTAMREAMLNIQIDPTTPHINKRDVVESILVAGKRNAGNIPAGRGWSANLSAKTVRQLTQEGVFA